MLFVDLGELRSLFEIDPDDKTQDKNLQFYNEMIASWIEELLDQDFTYKERTEYYGGTGTQFLPLRHRPVYLSPTPAVYVDESGLFGSPDGSFDGETQITFGDDFALDLSKDDPTISKSGLLVRPNNLWPKPSARQRGLLSPFIAPAMGNVKVTYTAGYTANNLPAVFRLAAARMVAELRYLFPLGVTLASDSYEDRNISRLEDRKGYIMDIIRPLLFNYRNRLW